MAEASLGGAASPAHELMISVLAQNWWAIGIRGVLGILFGLIALFLPGATMLSLVIVFATYAFVDGVFGIVSAIRTARQHERWWLLVLEAFISIAAAAVAVLWPGITVVAFVFVVAFSAVHGHIGIDCGLSAPVYRRPRLADFRRHRISAVRCAADHRANGRGGSADLVAGRIRADIWRRLGRPGL